ncbi:MAG: hypothetical protein M3Y81_15970 [Chloroflexota bacterium]|nr:hypothetical protein [Chloroflexota bacterium]
MAYNTDCRTMNSSRLRYGVAAHGCSVPAPFALNLVKLWTINETENVAGLFCFARGISVPISRGSPTP